MLKSLASVIVGALILMAVPATVYAADQVDIFNNPAVCQNGEGKDAAVCKNYNSKDNSPKNTNPIIGSKGILTTLINILSLIVGIIAVIAIVLAGFKYVTSGTNPQDVNSARERVIYAVIALAIAASAQVIVRVVLERIVA